MMEKHREEKENRNEYCGLVPGQTGDTRHAAPCTFFCFSCCCLLGREISSLHLCLGVDGRTVLAIGRIWTGKGGQHGELLLSINHCIVCKWAIILFDGWRHNGCLSLDQK